MGGAGCVLGKEKEWMDGLSPGRLQSVRYQRQPVDNCSQGGAEHFVTKWIAAEKARAGLRPERDGKDQGKDSPKQACSYCFVCHSY